MCKHSIAALLCAAVAGANPTGLVITELMYNPPGDDAQLEFIEVHNSGPVIFDISGYTLSGDVRFAFPAGTFLEGRSYLVVAADAARIAAVYAISNVAGGLDGRLTNDGGIVSLNEPGGAPICIVDYNDRRRWPSAADGTGHSLVLRNPYADPGASQNWTWSLELGGSPGRANYPEPLVTEHTHIEPHEVWRYCKGTTAPSVPSSAWRGLEFDDAAWLAGATGFGYGDNDDATVLADMQNGYASVFARKVFTIDDVGAIENLILRVNFDDGFVAYLNGIEVARSCLGSVGQDFAYNALATASHEAGAFESFAIANPAAVLREGPNVLACQVHNISLGSTDASFVPWLLDRTVTLPQEVVRLPVALNEIRADGPRSFIELFNGSAERAALDGCLLRLDAEGAAPYVVPAGASIDGGGFLLLAAEQLPFALEPGEIRLFLTHPDGLVIDARIFTATEPQASHARFPDGAAEWVTSLEPSPAAANVCIVEDGIVINEIMYNPPSGDGRDEYLELYNRSDRAIDLSGCRFTEGIEFEFPEGVVIAPDDYLVIAADAARLAVRYALDGGRIVGDFRGVLADGGETLRLADRHDNIMDEVKYCDGGRWPQWADGMGSSIELIDPTQDNGVPAAWAASDETAAAAWVAVSYTGTCRTVPRENELHFLLLDAGECRIDNLAIRPGGSGDNLALNGDFATTDMSRWRMAGTHGASAREAGTGVGDSACLRITATGAGDNRANGLELDTTTAFAAGTSYTVSFDARWLRGCNVLHTRNFDYDLMHTHTLPLPARTGTPCARNSAWSANLGPVISGVTQNPIAPQAGQQVRVVARISDSDGVAAAAAYYATARPASFQAALLWDDGAHDDGGAGDGLWSGLLPAMADRTKVLFYVHARDARGAVSVFPDGAPGRTCLYQAGAIPSSRLHVYSLIMDDDNTVELETRPLHSNQMIDGTLVFNDTEIYYNAGIRYRGSPWQRGGWPRMFRVEVNEDEPFHGVTSLNLSRYGVRQNERMAYYVHRLLGSPSSFQFYTRVQYNGAHYGTFEHIQPVNSRWLKLWWPDDAEGKLYKITGRHKFDDAGGFVENVWCSFTNHGTNADDYRWWFIPTNHETVDSHAELIALCRLMDPALTSATAFDAQAEGLIDTEQWLRLHTLSIVNDDWDTIGVGNGQNAYVYFATGAGKWRLLPWDEDHTFGNAGASLYPTPDAGIARFIGRPQYHRLYNRFLSELITGPYSVARLSPVLDGTALVLGTESAEADPQGIKNYITSRAQLVASALPLKTPFAITSNLGNDFSTPLESVSIIGNGSYEVAVVTCNGQPAALRWTSETSWTTPVALQPGPNPLIFVAYRGDGTIIAGDTITVTCTKTYPPPAVTAAMPPEGPEAGGIEIDIAGTGFFLGSKVFFGDAAAQMHFVSSELLVALLPPGAGDVAVRIENPDGQQGTLPVPFRYIPAYTPFVRGNANADASIDIADAIAVLGYLFSQQALTCRKAADANDDGVLDIADAIAVLGRLFGGNGPLPLPDACGEDPTDDALTCEVFAGCAP